MRRYLGVGIFLVAAALVGSRSIVLRSSEPSYAGKSASQWLDAGYEDCAMALQEMGPGAGPYILAKLAQEDSRYGTSLVYRRIRTKLPPAIRGMIPKPKAANFSEQRATSTLLELGPPIAPLLVSRLKDRNPAVRSTCARALGELRRQGSDIRRALPALTEASRDSNPQVAALALAAISDWPTAAARTR